MQPHDTWGTPQHSGPPMSYQPGNWGPTPQQAWGPTQQPATQQQHTSEEPPDPYDLLDGGHRSAQFPTIGTTVGGRIIARPKTTQQRDFQTKQLKFYPDTGRPAWQVVVPVQAQQPSEDDDGVRAFYLKGQVKQAVTAAVRQAGAERLEVGGVLHIRYVRDEPSKSGGMPQKLYEARYTPPTSGAAPAAAPAARPANAPISGLPGAGRPPQPPPPATPAFPDEPPF